MGQEHQTQNVFVFSREKTKVPDGPEYLTVSKLEIDNKDESSWIKKLSFIIAELAWRPGTVDHPD